MNRAIQTRYFVTTVLCIMYAPDYVPDKSPKMLHVATHFTATRNNMGKSTQLNVI